MRAGDLDQRVTIERFAEVQDPNTGVMIEGWAPLATVWAAVEPLNGREYLASQAVQAALSTRIRIRYRPSLTATDRVSHDDKKYNILTIINPQSGGRELVLMCEAVA